MGKKKYRKQYNIKNVELQNGITKVLVSFVEKLAQIGICTLAKKKGVDKMMKLTDTKHEDKIKDALIDSGKILLNSGTNYVSKKIDTATNKNVNNNKNKVNKHKKKKVIPNKK